MINPYIKRVLIYRLGSIGDSVVALPSLNLIARSFPRAERILLTNIQNNRKAAPMSDIIAPAGLIHSSITYPLGTRNIKALWRLRSRIAQSAPQALVYLTKPRGTVTVFRDVLFFFLCGIPKLIGVPFLPSQQKVLAIEKGRIYESEANRLARCLKYLGKIDTKDPKLWDLKLSSNEMATAKDLLNQKLNSNVFITASVGTKVKTKDWGKDNWYQLLSLVSSRFPDLGLALIGSYDERLRCDYVARGWRGPKLNLAGAASPRESAAVMAKSVLFLGHDSGPMHLAAAAGVSCVAIFSSRNKPGEWYPAGNGHTILYNYVDCLGCNRMRCIDRNSMCIKSISVDKVFSTVRGKLKDCLFARANPKI